MDINAFPQLMFNVYLLINGMLTRNDLYMQICLLFVKTRFFVFTACYCIIGMGTLIL